MSKPLVKVMQTSLIHFSKGLRLQEYINNQYNNPGADPDDFKNVLILTEHYPVYTIGIRNKDYTACDEYKLRKTGADFYKTNRGGLITFHGPGQLVAYPILQLKQFVPSMRWYISRLEDTVIDVCRQFDVKAGRTQDTGIWVKDNKICAVGVHGSRFVTTHGIALNCNTQLDWFNHITPCGIEDKGVTSLSKELKKNVTIDTVIPIFIKTFSQKFKCDITEYVASATKRALR